MYIIGIAGGTGSGKTTVVKKIIEALPTDKVAVIPLDSYYNDTSHLSMEERKKINFDHPNAFDWKLLTQQIQTLREHKSIEQPTYSYLISRSSAKDSFDHSQISKEIREFLKLYGDLRPAMCICYDRIAMIGTEDAEFRVTFDRNITWNDKCTDLRKAGEGRKLLKDGQCLMEIKVSNSMPMGLARKLSELRIFPVSFSKYGSGYADMINTVTYKKTERTADLSPVKESGVMKGVAAYV